MNDYIVGEEYLFSNDGEGWLKGRLDFLDWDRYRTAMRVYKSNGKVFHRIKTIEKPERKLYTQSMHDNGQPIEVGMWFIGAKSKEYECLIPPESTGCVVYMDVGRYHIIPPIPFPDPVKLINGKPYMFDYCGKEVLGFYSSHYKGFVDTMSSAVDRPVDDCTSIRTMKVDEGV